MELEKPKTMLDQLRDEQKETAERLKTVKSDIKKEFKSETIEVEQDLDTGKTSTTIDFMNDGEVNDFTKEKTKEAAEEKAGSKTRRTIDEIKSEINQQEGAMSNMSAEDLEMVAKFLIGLLDTALSTGLRFWSGDTSDSAYSLPIGKKNNLIEMLTYILVKHQIKFKIEVVFIITVLFAYSVPFMKAKENRSLRKKAEKQIKERDAAKSNKEPKVIKLKRPENEQDEQEQEDVQDVEIIIDKEENFTTQRPIKRQPRRPKK